MRGVIIRFMEPRPNGEKSRTHVFEPIRLLLIQAGEAADLFGQTKIGPEALLYAAILDPSVQGFLGSFGVAHDEVADQLATYLNNGDDHEGKKVLDQEAQRVLEMAVDEVRRRGETKVTPVRVVEGIVREHDSYAAFILSYLGLPRIDVVRRNLA